MLMRRGGQLWEMSWHRNMLMPQARYPENRQLLPSHGSPPSSPDDAKAIESSSTDCMRTLIPPFDSAIELRTHPSPSLHLGLALVLSPGEKRLSRPQHLAFKQDPRERSTPKWRTQYDLCQTATAESWPDLSSHGLPVLVPALVRSSATGFHHLSVSLEFRQGLKSLPPCSGKQQSTIGQRPMRFGLLPHRSCS